MTERDFGAELNELKREVWRQQEKRKALIQALELLLPGETDPIRKAHIEAAIKKDQQHIE